jgi:hypothetical protein
MAVTSPPFNPNKSPKQRFIDMGLWVTDHRVMVDSQAFTRACDFAMLQFQRVVTANVVDGNGAGAAGLRIQGAQQFLEIMRNLSETPQIPTTRNDDNLKH